MQVSLEIFPVYVGLSGKRGSAGSACSSSVVLTSRLAPQIPNTN